MVELDGTLGGFGEFWGCRGSLGGVLEVSTGRARINLSCHPRNSVIGESFLAGSYLIVDPDSP